MSHRPIRPPFPARRFAAGFATLGLIGSVGLAGLSVGCATRPSTATVGSREPVELPPGSFARSWVSDLGLSGGERVTGLYRLNDTLFAYTDRGMAHAISSGGSQRYVRDVGQRGTREVYPPVTLDDRIIFPTQTTFEVYGGNGAFVASVPAGSSVRSPATAGGVNRWLFAGVDARAGLGRVAAFDPRRAYAHRRWDLQQGSVSARPAVYDNTLFFATEQGRVYAVDASIGDRNPWGGLPGGYFQTDREVTADLVVDDYAVYVAGTDRKLYALDRTTGRLRWTYFAQASLRIPPVLTADAVYQAVPNRGLVKIARTQGDPTRQPLWVAEGVEQFVALDNTHVYGRRGDGTLVAIDRNSGQVRFTSRGGTPLRHFATNTDDGITYAATDSGQVYAIRPVLRPGELGELVAVPHSGTPAVAGR